PDPHAPRTLSSRPTGRLGYWALPTRGPRREEIPGPTRSRCPALAGKRSGERRMSMISWTEHGTERTARWQPENGAPPPARLEIADDTLTADSALRRLRDGTALLWRGDYPGARQLLTAVGRRIDRRRAPRHREIAQLFRAHRAQRAERARLLGGVVVLLEPGHRLDLRRAPDVAEACRAAYGESEEPRLVSLPELLGVLSAHQWQLNGVPIPALDARIHARYGVFSPVRSEYVDLVAEAPMPPVPGGAEAMDLGTGTGVLAAVLARRGLRTGEHPAPGTGGEGHRARGRPVPSRAGRSRGLQPALAARGGHLGPGAGHLRRRIQHAARLPRRAPRPPAPGRRSVADP